MSRCAAAVRYVLMLVLFAAAGCTDSPTASTAVADAPARRASVLGGTTGTPYPCLKSVRASGGSYRYRYGSMDLHFPAPTLSSTGATVEYRYRAESVDGDTLVMINCRIPATPAAIQYTNRRFGISEGRLRIVPDRAGVVSTAGCVEDGLCHMEALVVVVETCPDATWTLGDDGVCKSTRGGGAAGGGSTGGDWGDAGSGGGDSPDPGTPPAPCNSDTYPVLNSPGVQDGMQQLWNDTNPDYGDKIARTERGGWIVPAAGGGYTIRPFGDEAVAEPCGIDFNGVVPPGAIGYVHTHPWRTGESMESCGVDARTERFPTYRGNASKADIAFLRRAAGIDPVVTQGFVMDKNGITIFSPQTQASDPLGGGRDDRIARCNY